MKDNEKFLEIHKKRRELEKEYEERLEEIQKDYQLPYGAVDPTFYGPFGYEDLPPIDDNVERLAEEIRSLLKEEQKYITYIYPSDIAKESGKDSEKPWTSKDLKETIKKINEIADEGKPIEIMGYVSSLPPWVVTAILNELSQKNIPVIVDVERTSENITFHTYDVDLHKIKKEKEYSTNAVIKRTKGNQVLLTITDSENIDNMILPDIDSEKDVFIEWDASISRKTSILQSLIASAFRNNNSVSIGGDGKFTCAISNDENIQLGDITEDPTNKRKIVETLEKKLKETQTVVTHYGDDLDNKSATYVLQKLLNRGVWNEKDKKELKIARVPAGQIKEGMLNVDTGGHKGSRIEEDGTIVIDGDPENGVKSAIEELSNLGYYYYIPEQIVELADTVPNKVSALDSRSGLALIRYLSGEQAFKLAEEKLLDKTLTDEQLEEYGLE